MAPVILQPDMKYRHKLFAIIGLSGLLALVGSMALGAAIGNDAQGAKGLTIGVIVAVLVNLAWLVPVLLAIPPYYKSLRYEIHDDEVIVRVGIITRSAKHVPFRAVTNLQVKQGPFDRLFGIGTLEVQTAGANGETGAEESLAGLPNFQEVYEQMAVALRRFRGAMAPTQAEEEALPANGKLLREILEELQAIRRAVER